MMKPLAMIFSDNRRADKYIETHPEAASAVFKIDSDKQALCNNDGEAVQDVSGKWSPLNRYKNLDGTNVIGAFILPDEVDNSNDYAWSRPRIHASKCICTCCNNIQDTNREVSPGEISYSPSSREPESCSECGTVFEKYEALRRNLDGTYDLPETATGIYVWEKTDDETGKPTGIMQNIMTTKGKVQPNGKISFDLYKYAQFIDIEKKEITQFVQKKVASEDGKSTWETVKPVSAAFDPYTYRTNVKDGSRRPEVFPRIFHFSKLQDYGIHEDAYLPNPKKDTSYELNTRAIDNGALSRNPLYSMIQDLKIKVLEKKFAMEGSIFGADKEGSLINNAKDSEYFSKIPSRGSSKLTEFKDAHIMLMVRYPAAYELASYQTNIDITNDYYDKVRSAQKRGKDTSDIEISPKGRALFFRNRLVATSDALCACDDNINDAVKRANNLSELKANLEKIAFGDNAGKIKAPDNLQSGEASPDMRIEVDRVTDKSMSPGKKLKKEFWLKNPIGDTSTIYTFSKLFKTSDKTVNYDDCMKLVEVGRSAPVAYATHENKGHPRERLNIGGGTIKPAVTKWEMSFLKRFTRDKSVDKVIDEVYKDQKTASLYEECLRMYNTIKSSAHVIADEPKLQEELMNKGIDLRSKIDGPLKDYLQDHAVEEAYVAFVDKYTPDQVNEEIKKIQNAQDPNSGTEIDKYGDMLLLNTRNGKPLIENRTLREIHDELSIMNRHMVTENDDFDKYYSESERALEAELSDPAGSGKYTFKLHKDSYDIIRSSSVLYNCLGVSHVSNTQSKSKFYLYMEDPNGKRVAAIELGKTSNPDKPYHVYQFQAAHDNALGADLAPVAMQWLNDMNIDYEGTRDVALFGTGESIYGGEDADYRSSVLNPVTGLPMSVSAYDDFMRNCKRTAEERYKTDEGFDFGVSIPYFENDNGKHIISDMSCINPRLGKESIVIHQNEENIDLDLVDETKVVENNTQYSG